MNESIIKYFTLFYEVKGGELSDRAAYEKTEKIWATKYGFSKYSSLESFRTMRGRYLRWLLRSRKT